MTSSAKEDIIKDALQVSPAVTTTGGLYFYGIPLADLVAIASLVLICVQAAYRIWKWKKEAKEYENQSESGKRIPSSDNDSD